MRDLHIIKIGGNIIDDPEELNSFLHQFTEVRGPKILVHGGGKLATSMSAKLGIPVNMIEGRRITDPETLKVVTMVYAGWINKSITAKLNALNCEAIGLSGADVFCLPAHKRENSQVDFGLVGDIEEQKINTSFLASLIEKGLCIVLAPITADANGQLLNTNADTIAAALAKALSPEYSTNLIYCFEKNGVQRELEDERSLISTLDFSNYVRLKDNGNIAGGMIPKLDNAFAAARSGATVKIGHARYIHQLTDQYHNAGTTISI
jgi:acetylglutamate kinase